MFTDSHFLSTIVLQGGTGWGRILLQPTCKKSTLFMFCFSPFLCLSFCFMFCYLFPIHSHLHLFSLALTCTQEFFGVLYENKLGLQMFLCLEKSSVSLYLYKSNFETFREINMTCVLFGVCVCVCVRVCVCVCACVRM